MVSKKAQAWGFDLMIASIIFVFAIIVFFLYSLNYPTESQDKLETLFYEGNFIADSFLSEGIPLDWTEDDVTKIGIVDNGKINETKLQRLYNMATPATNIDGYLKSKALLNTQYDYFFNFSKPIDFGGSPIPEHGIGLHPTSNATNLLKVTRLTIYRNRTVSMDIYVWE